MMRYLIIGLLALLAAPSWAQVKISELPAAATLTGAEQIPVVQSGVTVKTTAAAIGISSSGQYTPTCTALTNITSVACTLQWTWSRTVSTVIVSGHLLITPASAGNASSTFSISLPIASDLANLSNLGGTCNGGPAASSAPQSMQVRANSATNVADVFFASVATENVAVSCIFQYIIL